MKTLQQLAEKIGAKVHIIENVTVEYLIPHNDLALKSGPESYRESDVFKVADQYPYTKETITASFVLLNFTNGGSYEKALSWCKENNLIPSFPKDIFAIAEQNPTLNKTFDMNYMYLAETTGCTFGGNLQACYVWWRDSKREANLDWQGYFDGSYDWFVFRKSSDTGKLITPQILDPLSSELSAQEQEVAAISLLKQRGFKINKEY